MNINRQSPIPLYEQVKGLIKQMIHDQDLSLGDRIPSERDLALEYGVARLTVRRAISELIAEGLLFSTRGKGTLVGRCPDLGRGTRPFPQMIGLIIPVKSPIGREMLRGVEEEAKIQGYHVIFASSGDQEDDVLYEFGLEKEILAAHRKAGVLGHVISPANGDYVIDHLHISELQRSKTPFILLNGYFRDLNADYVITNNREAACEVVTHLIRLGHEKVGFVTTLPRCHSTSSEDRFQGYKEALSHHGLSFDEKLVGWNGSTKQGIRSFLKQLKTPYALFCETDRLAVQVISVIQEEGMKIPEDVAVVGYDDLELAQHLAVPLTTMRNPVFEIGKRAVAKLARRIRGEVEEGVVQQEIVRSELVIRESCGSALRHHQGASS